LGDDVSAVGTLVSGAERRARAALSFVAEPGEPALGALLKSCRPAEILDAVLSGRDPRTALPAAGRGVPGLPRAVGRWRARAGRMPPPARLEAWERAGMRLACPGDPEWPTQLDGLGDARPLVLWLQGSADLRFACLRSVSVVGARAATGYGEHVATELAATLAERGWCVISGGAYGIDSCAHRGALGAGGITVAVLASGLGYGYPQGHRELFASIAGNGVVVSEWPPDRAPTRPGFLVRNRVIAALSCGTVVVEAALRSGALSTARHARDLCRPLMAVPGPVTSAQSAGCHEIIREWGAVCVTGAQDVIENVSPSGDGLGPPRCGPAAPRDSLDPVTRAVLEAVPSRGGSGPAAIAVTAGADLNTAIRCLGALAAAGFVERCARGWRIRKDA
jgi:DNA processing protein